MITVENNIAEKRFVATRDGVEIGEITYQADGQKLAMIHTGVPPQFAGQGIASDLARLALDSVRENGQSVVPRCPFIASFIEKNPQYSDLLESD